jgi:hypothetical protein
VDRLFLRAQRHPVEARLVSIHGGRRVKTGGHIIKP